MTHNKIKKTAIRVFFALLGLWTRASCTAQVTEDEVPAHKFYLGQNSSAYFIEYNLPKVRYNKRIKLSPVLVQENGEHITLASVRGDTGWQVKKKLIRIEWDPLKEQNIQVVATPPIRLKKITETLKAPVIESIHYLGSNSTPYGLKYISKTSPIPFYLAGRMLDLPPSHGNDVISTTGKINYLRSGVYIVQNERKFSSYAVSGGFVFRTGKKLYVNFGGGYGAEQLFWKIDEYNLDYKKTGSTWAITENTLNQAGEFFEAGLMWKQNRTLFSLGASTIQFTIYQISFGFNFIFIH